ncbi:hypothetical protein C8R44DRAFT_982578 [Mycena epipterygia]|nr:hypothetical protein C8R44DRAFT_982578 [Mycena epipterygia]
MTRSTTSSSHPAVSSKRGGSGSVRKPVQYSGITNKAKWEPEIAAVKRRVRLELWKIWYSRHLWTPTSNAVDHEHESDAMVVYKTRVKSNFRLNDEELSTLPCMNFESPQGRKTSTYVYSDVMNLVYRKFAVLAGEKADSVDGLFRKGRSLFEKDAALYSVNLQTKLQKLENAGKGLRAVSVEHSREISSRIYTTKNKDLSSIQSPQATDAPDYTFGVALHESGIDKALNSLLAAQDGTIDSESEFGTGNE